MVYDTESLGLCTLSIVRNYEIEKINQISETLCLVVIYNLLQCAKSINLIFLMKLLHNA
jgi:hypothetical protein